MSEWISYLPNATAPAWWGAALSTLLAIVKIWELWRERFRIHAVLISTTNRDIGNEIRIRNLSPQHLIITDWELFYGARFWSSLKKKSIHGREYDADDYILAPYSTYKCTFSDELFFRTDVKHLKGRAIYLKLHFAGRRPTLRKLYF